MTIPVIGLKENLQETMVFIDVYHYFYGGFRLKCSQQNQSIEPCMPSVSEYEPKKKHGKSLGPRDWWPPNSTCGPGRRSLSVWWMFSVGHFGLSNRQGFAGICQGPKDFAKFSNNFAKDLANFAKDFAKDSGFCYCLVWIYDLPSSAIDHDSDHTWKWETRPHRVLWLWVKKPSTPGTLRHSWDSWMFIPPVIICHNRVLTITICKPKKTPKPSNSKYIKHVLPGLNTICLLAKSPMCVCLLLVNTCMAGSAILVLTVHRLNPTYEKISITNPLYPTFVGWVSMFICLNANLPDKPNPTIGTLVTL